MFNIKTILQGTPGVSHVVDVCKIPTANNMTIFTQGNNVSTMWNGTTIINNTRYWDDDED